MRYPLLMLLPALFVALPVGCGGGTVVEEEAPIRPYYNYLVAERQDAVYLFATLRAKGQFERDPLKMTFLPYVAADGRAVNIHIADPSATQPTTIPSKDREGGELELHPIVDRIAVAYKQDTGIELTPASTPGANLADLLARDSEQAVGSSPEEKREAGVNDPTSRPTTRPAG